VETEGLGRLHFNIRDALKRTWDRETRLDRQQKSQRGTTPQLSGKHAPAKKAERGAVGASGSRMKVVARYLHLCSRSELRAARMSICRVYELHPHVSRRSGSPLVRWWNATSSTRPVASTEIP